MYMRTILIPRYAFVENVINVLQNCYKYNRVIIFPNYHHQNLYLEIWLETLVTITTFSEFNRTRQCCHCSNYVTSYIVAPYTYQKWGCCRFAFKCSPKSIKTLILKQIISADPDRIQA